MELFKNGVGRPSNEIKKKRRNFVIAIILVCVIAIGGLSYLVINNFSSKENTSNKLKGDAFYNSVPASKNIKYMKVDGGLIGWTLSGNKLKVGFYPYGDVNLDGFVSYKDARTVLKMAAKLISNPSKGFKLLLLDMNKNGKITAGDARTILKISKKDSTKAQCYCVSTKKGYCNWANEDSNVEKIYYLKKGIKYYINSRNDNFADDKIYSSGAITTNSSSKVNKNKWIWANVHSLDLSTDSGCYSDGTCPFADNRDVVKFYSNDGFSKVEYDTDLVRVRRLDNGKKAGYAKYKIYSKFKPIGGEYYTAVSVITKNGARDTVNVKISGESIPTHNTEYWIKKKANGLPIYIDKACNNNQKFKKTYQIMINEINKLPKYVAGSVNYVEILNSKNFASHRTIVSDDIPAGEYFSKHHKIMLNCEAGATKHTVFHEFGHAIDNFYYESTGTFLHRLDGFYKDYNTSLKYKDKILTWNHGYAYANENEFFAQAFTSYILINSYGRKHADLSKIGQTIYIKNVVDLNWRIKTESMPAYNKLYKTIFVD